jgi:small subunit ribosomal protein S3
MTINRKKKQQTPLQKKTTVKAATKKTTVKAATKKTEAKEEPVVTDKADTTESSNEESSKDNNEA